MVVATGARVVVVVVAIDRARSRYRARARRGDGGALLTRSRFARGWVAPRTRVAPDTARDLASLMERLARTSPSVCVRCVDGRVFRIHTPPPLPAGAFPSAEDGGIGGENSISLTG